MFGCKVLLAVNYIFVLQSVKWMFVARGFMIRFAVQKLILTLTILFYSASAFAQMPSSNEELRRQFQLGPYDNLTALGIEFRDLPDLELLRRLAREGNPEKIKTWLDLNTWLLSTDIENLEVKEVLEILKYQRDIFQKSAYQPSTLKEVHQWWNDPILVRQVWKEFSHTIPDLFSFELIDQMTYAVAPLTGGPNERMAVFFDVNHYSNNRFALEFDRINVSKSAHKDRTSGKFYSFPGGLFNISDQPPEWLKPESRLGSWILKQFQGLDEATKEGNRKVVQRWINDPKTTHAQFINALFAAIDNGRKEIEHDLLGSRFVDASIPALSQTRHELVQLEILWKEDRSDGIKMHEDKVQRLFHLSAYFGKTENLQEFIFKLPQDGYEVVHFDRRLKNNDIDAAAMTLASHGDAKNLALFVKSNAITMRCLAEMIHETALIDGDGPVMQELLTSQLLHQRGVREKLLNQILEEILKMELAQSIFRHEHREEIRNLTMLDEPYKKLDALLVLIKDNAIKSNLKDRAIQMAIENLHPSDHEQIAAFRKMAGIQEIGSRSFRRLEATILHGPFNPDQQFPIYNDQHSITSIEHKIKKLESGLKAINSVQGATTALPEKMKMINDLYQHRIKYLKTRMAVQMAWQGESQFIMHLFETTHSIPERAYDELVVVAFSTGDKYLKSYLAKDSRWVVSLQDAKKVSSKSNNSVVYDGIASYEKSLQPSVVNSWLRSQFVSRWPSFARWVAGESQQTETNIVQDEMLGSKPEIVSLPKPQSFESGDVYEAIHYKILPGAQPRSHLVQELAAQTWGQLLELPEAKELIKTKGAEFLEYAITAYALNEKPITFQIFYAHPDMPEGVKVRAEFQEFAQQHPIIHTNGLTGKGFWSFFNYLGEQAANLVQGWVDHEKNQEEQSVRQSDVAEKGEEKGRLKIAKTVYPNSDELNKTISDIAITTGRKLTQEDIKDPSGTNIIELTTPPVDVITAFNEVKDQIENNPRINESLKVIISELQSVEMPSQELAWLSFIAVGKNRLDVLAVIANQKNFDIYAEPCKTQGSLIEMVIDFKKFNAFKFLIKHSKTDQLTKDQFKPLLNSRNKFVTYSETRNFSLLAKVNVVNETPVALTTSIAPIQTDPVTELENFPLINAEEAQKNIVDAALAYKDNSSKKMTEALSHALVTQDVLNNALEEINRRLSKPRRERTCQNYSTLPIDAIYTLLQNSSIDPILALKTIELLPKRIKQNEVAQLQELVPSLDARKQIIVQRLIAERRDRSAVSEAISLLKAVVAAKKPFTDQEILDYVNEIRKNPEKAPFWKSLVETLGIPEYPDLTNSRAKSFYQHGLYLHHLTNGSMHQRDMKVAFREVTAEIFEIQDRSRFDWDFQAACDVMIFGIDGESKLVATGEINKDFLKLSEKGKTETDRFDFENYLKKYSFDSAITNEAFAILLRKVGSNSSCHDIFRTLLQETNSGQYSQLALDLVKKSAMNMSDEMYVIIEPFLDLKARKNLEFIIDAGAGNLKAVTDNIVDSDLKLEFKKIAFEEAIVNNRTEVVEFMVTRPELRTDIVMHFHYLIDLTTNLGLERLELVRILKNYVPNSEILKAMGNKDISSKMFSMLEKHVELQKYYQVHKNSILPITDQHVKSFVNKVVQLVSGESTPIANGKNLLATLAEIGGMDAEKLKSIDKATRMKIFNGLVSAQLNYDQTKGAIQYLAKAAQFEHQAKAFPKEFGKFFSVLLVLELHRVATRDDVTMAQFIELLQHGPMEVFKLATFSATAASVTTGWGMAEQLVATKLHAEYQHVLTSEVKKVPKWQEAFGKHITTKHIGRMQVAMLAAVIVNQIIYGPKMSGEELLVTCMRTQAEFFVAQLTVHQLALRGIYSGLKYSKTLSNASEIAYTGAKTGSKLIRVTPLGWASLLAQFVIVEKLENKYQKDTTITQANNDFYQSQYDMEAYLRGANLPKACDAFQDKDSCFSNRVLQSMQTYDASALDYQFKEQQNVLDQKQTALDRIYNHVVLLSDQDAPTAYVTTGIKLEEYKTDQRKAVNEYIASINDRMKEMQNTIDPKKRMAFATIYNRTENFQKIIQTHCANLNEPNLADDEIIVRIQKCDSEIGNYEMTLHEAGQTLSYVSKETKSQYNMGLSRWESEPMTRGQFVDQTLYMITRIQNLYATGHERLRDQVSQQMFMQLMETVMHPVVSKMHNATPGIHFASFNAPLAYGPEYYESRTKTYGMYDEDAAKERIKELAQLLSKPKESYKQSDFHRHTLSVVIPDKNQAIAKYNEIVGQMTNMYQCDHSTNVWNDFVVKKLGVKLEEPITGKLPKDDIGYIQFFTPVEIERHGIPLTQYLQTYPITRSQLSVNDLACH